MVKSQEADPDGVNMSEAKDERYGVCLCIRDADTVSNTNHGLETS